MKFMVIFRDRPTEPDPAAAQRRAARLLNQRPMPSGLTVYEFVARVGSGGGYAVVETGDPADLQQLATLFAGYDCRIEPVVDVAFYGGRRERPVADLRTTPSWRQLPDMPPSEPHEGAFSDDDVYDTED